MTTNQAADYLGVTPKTLRTWESEGKVKAIRTLGGHRRFYKKDLNELLNR
ncbi:MAG: helix-turn-helix domain-containing protein [Halothece sp.]